MAIIHYMPALLIGSATPACNRFSTGESLTGTSKPDMVSCKHCLKQINKRGRK